MNWNKKINNHIYFIMGLNKWLYKRDLNLQNNTKKKGLIKFINK